MTSVWPGIDGLPALASRLNWQRKSLQLPYATDAGETDAPEILWGTGSPEAVLAGAIGDRYFAIDTGDSWYKRTGAGTTTGWSKYDSGLRTLLTQSGYDPDAVGLDLRNTIGPIQITAALASPDRSIRRDTSDGFLRLMGGSSPGTSGQIRVFGRAFGAGYDVDCRTPNASAAETFRWGIGGGIDWPSFDIRNVSQVNLLQSGTVAQFLYGYSTFQTITGAPDGAGLVAGHFASGVYNATDATLPTPVKHVGVYSGTQFGQSAAAIGSAWSFGATMTVNQSGHSGNELACYFGSMQSLLGSNYRAWFTDFTLLGPTTGIQMNLAGGVTMLINNYFNGAMAANGTVACFNAVSRTGQGAGGNVGEFVGKTTYAVDAGFQVCGWAGTTGAKTAGFTTAFLAGGTGGMWNAAKDTTGTPDANALSIIGIAFEGRDVTTYGVKIHTPNQATAIGFAVSGGTWAKGLDLSGATFNTNAIHTGIGPVQFGDRTGIGTGASTTQFAVLGGAITSVTGTTQTGMTFNPTFAGATAPTVEIVVIRPQFTISSAYTCATAYVIRIQAPSLSGGGAVTDLVGLEVNSLSTGTNNWALRTNAGVVRLGDRTGVGVTVGAGNCFQVQSGLNMALTGVTQRGILSDFTSNSAATSATRALEVRAQTAAAAYTCTDVAGLYVGIPIVGAGSTATNVYGLYIDNQTGGGTSYSIYTNGGQHRLGGTVNVTTGALQMAGTQVVTTRRTGWTAWTGTATRTTFATGTATLVNVAEALKALIDDLITHGLIGA